VPPDSVRCTRTVQSPTSHSRVSLGTLRYNSSDCPVHQRSNGYFAHSSTAKAEEQRNSAQQCTAESERRVRGALDSEQCLSGVAPDCPVPPEDIASNGRQLLNPNAWVTWLAHRTVSGAPIDSSPPQRLVWWLRAINTPNHHHSKHPRFLSITFNTKALAFTPRHNSKDQSLSKSQIQLKHLVTCEIEILCSFELLPLGLPSSFLISFLK
jgi:hypothetical protein